MPDDHGGLHEYLETLNVQMIKNGLLKVYLFDIARQNDCKTDISTREDRSSLVIIISSSLPISERLALHAF